jgi:hypothetical protein
MSRAHLRIAEFCSAVIAVLLLAMTCTAPTYGATPLHRAVKPRHASVPAQNVAALVARLQASSGSAFGGAYYDAHGTLVILTTKASTTATLRSAEASFKRARSAPPVAYRVVRFSSSNLQRLQDSLAPRTATLSRAGTAVNLIAVDAPANLLRVGLGTNNATNRARVLRAIGSSGREVEFTQASPVPAVATRFNDVSPWNAGDRIFNAGDQAACSSGIGIHDNQGHHFLITAAHCSTTLGSQDFFYNGSAGCSAYPGVCDPGTLNTKLHAMGFSQSVNFTASGWDTQLIAAPSSDLTWTATASRSAITAAYTPIHNDANQIINEGATSFGWQSGSMTVNMVNGCINVQYPNLVQQKCHLWSADQPNTSFCAVRGGDSGGPDVSYSGFGPLAVGENVAGNCRTVYFHSVGDMIAKNPWLVPGPAVNTTTHP